MKRTIKVSKMKGLLGGEADFFFGGGERGGLAHGHTSLTTSEVSLFRFI